MSVITPAQDVNPAYLTDASGYKGWADRVFAPTAESGVEEVMLAAREQGIPLTVSGAGSGLTGARVPQGGWVLSLENFRRLEIGKGFARAGVAISLIELRDAAAQTQQFYAPDPTELTASIGGTIATNASGSRSFRFGSTRRHLRAIRVALMDGRIVEYRRGDAIDFPVPTLPIPNTAKYTAGYPLRPGMDWIDLFCGSEGTLGVILEAEVALLPVPEELFSGVIFFPSDEHALTAVDKWRTVPGLRMLEYVDRNALDLLLARYPEIPAQALAALLIESEGDDLDAWEERMTEASAFVDASWFAVNVADRERFRLFRHSLPELVNAAVLQKGILKMGTDYAVPLDRSREMLSIYRSRLEAALPGQYVIYGHIGDAHVHVGMLPATGQQAEIATGLLKQFAKDAVALGGTVSAEHGLGKRKAHLLSLQYSPEQIRAMIDVKRRLDPNWILGRGTLLPVPDEI